MQPLLFAAIGLALVAAAALEPVSAMRWRQVGLLYLLLEVLAVFYLRERPSAPEADHVPPAPAAVSSADRSRRDRRSGSCAEARIVNVRRDGRDWRVIEACWCGPSR